VATAERLFAEHGIAGVSLRDVSAAAGQRNHSAAQYHFGDRHGLVVAVYEARMTHVDERRRALLAELDAAGRDRELAALVEATLLPLLEVVAETDAWYARFLARTRWDPTAWAIIESIAQADGFRTAVRRLVRALDDLPRPILRSRLDQLMTLIIGTIAGWEGAPDRGETRLAIEDLAADLVATSVALLTAPVAGHTGDRRTDRTTASPVTARPASGATS
jgi:AcrR family transcriptional regulator